MSTAAADDASHYELKPRRPWMSRSMRTFVALVLLVVGVQVWLGAKEGATGTARQMVALGVAVLLGAVLMAVRPLRDASFAALEWVRDPSPLRRRLTALLLAAVAGGYLYWVAAAQGRGFGPVLHDEYCYQIQARMLAQGKLWMPEHELAEFFDSFHLITDGVFAVKYTPGTALVNAPAALLGVPFWVTSLVLCSLSVGLLYLILTRLVDGFAGLLGALMLLAGGMVILRDEWVDGVHQFEAIQGVFRRVAIETLSQPPMLFWLLVAVWSFFHWRDRWVARVREESAPTGGGVESSGRGIGWLIVMGVAVGMGAITRPVDAVSMAAPLTLGVLLTLWRVRAPGREWGRTVLVGLAAIAPFALLQLACNKGMTGSFTKLPWVHYADREDPYDTINPKQAKVDAFDVGSLGLPQKVKFVEEFSAEQYKAHKASGAAKRVVSRRLMPALELTLPNPVLFVLVPLGFVAALSRGRWVLGGSVALFLLIYSGYPFFLDHYLVLAMPALLLIALGGWDWLARSLPPLERPVRVLGGLGILALTLTALPPLKGGREVNEWPMAEMLRTFDAQLKPLADRPSIVLFRFDKEESDVHAEPVYNADVAWPDDARVIRAHDLGPAKNVELYRYYAAKSPERAVYAYDRAKEGKAEALTYLGTVREMAERPVPATAPATRRASAARPGEASGSSPSAPNPAWADAVR